MTHHEKLNAILHVLLWRGQKGEFRQSSKLVTFHFICKTVAEVTEEWEFSFLQKILLGDGYMIMVQEKNEELPEITHAGIKFIQNGGYTQAKKDTEIEREIKQKTLKKFRYDKLAFWISVLTFFVATSLNIYNLINGRSKEREIKLLKEQINHLQSSSITKPK